MSINSVEDFVFWAVAVTVVVVVTAVVAVAVIGLSLIRERPGRGSQDQMSSATLVAPEGSRSPAVEDGAGKAA